MFDIKNFLMYSFNFRKDKFIFINNLFLISNLFYLFRFLKLKYNNNYIMLYFNIDLIKLKSFIFDLLQYFCNEFNLLFFFKDYKIFIFSLEKEFLVNLVFNYNKFFSFNFKFFFFKKL